MKRVRNKRYSERRALTGIRRWLVSRLEVMFHKAPLSWLANMADEIFESYILRCTFYIQIARRSTMCECFQYSLLILIWQCFISWRTAGQSDRHLHSLGTSGEHLTSASKDLKLMRNPRSRLHEMAVSWNHWEHHLWCFLSVNSSIFYCWWRGVFMWLSS